MTEPFQITDPSSITDADWVEINKLRTALQTGSKHVLQQAYRELGKDPVRYIRVMRVIYPNEVQASIRDAMAKRGLTEQDILDAVRKRENPAGDQ